MPSAAASAKACTWRSGRSIIRWTSMKPPASCTWSRMPATISGPIVIGGTKCPSITSTWMTRAPASITVAIWSPSRLKSADRIDGATRRPSGYSVAMDAREYRRRTTQRPKPLIAAIAFAALAAAVWVVGVSLSLIWDVEVDVLSPVLGALIVAAVVSAGAQLNNHRNRWVRGAGVLMITGGVLVVLGVLLIIWYASALCGSGECS